MTLGEPGAGANQVERPVQRYRRCDLHRALLRWSTASAATQPDNVTTSPALFGKGSRRLPSSCDHPPGEPFLHSCLGDIGATSAIASYLAAVPSVDEVGVGERVATLGTRSIKKASKRDALLLAVRMMDLTTLEGKDTRGEGGAIVRQGDPARPGGPFGPAGCGDMRLPQSGAIRSRRRLSGTSVKVASVATYFPSGQAPLEGELDETQTVVAMGADEIDMVIDRGAFLAGRHLEVSRRSPRSGSLRAGTPQGDPRDGQLGTSMRASASMLAMAAGRLRQDLDGQGQPAATLPVRLVMLEAIRDFERLTGVAVGMKPAGGIRVSKDAIKWLVIVHRRWAEWLTPDRFRIGASSLLNDVLMQLRWLATGRYQSPTTSPRPDVTVLASPNAAIAR